jgi:hypothetical protein
MKMQKFRKTELSLALASVLAGLGASGASYAHDHEPELANADRLGDAALFQYYTAKGDWQTFFRLVNTSDKAIVVKLRYREAANSREVLDFEVALSPKDMWSAWTDKDALADKADGPGIRTSDTSCVFPPPQSGGGQESEGFVRIGGATDPDLIGALFKDKGFAPGGIYDDNGTKNPPSVLDRLSEGHLEVIGVASYDCNDGDQEQFFCQEVSHKDSGKPEDCGVAWKSYKDNKVRGDDMRNVLATNAYLINVPTGQGAGYDPDMISDCAHRSLEWISSKTDTSPDFDSCDPGSFAYWYGKFPVALNQRLWDGSVPPGLSKDFLQADMNKSGDYGDRFNVDLNGDSKCLGDELNISERNVPQAVYDAVGSECKGGANNDCQWNKINSDNCNYQVVNTGGNQNTPFLTSVRTATLPFARLKQKGHLDFGLDGTNQFPVMGGVDAVSSLFMRDSVINEWAASLNPDPQAVVIDYFTQWVLTFPTKHYYVDLQTDLNLKDDISPTLVDISKDNDAFAPFSQEFDDGDQPGTSCEPFEMAIYDREESEPGYTSPAPYSAPGLCWETNVVSFTDAYAGRGLDSSFGFTVPKGDLPYDYTRKQVAERGWAQLWFTGDGASVGLSDMWKNYYGLPVTGFLFSVYNTLTPERNHTTVNAHKYTRDSDRCYYEHKDGDRDLDTDAALMTADGYSNRSKKCAPLPLVPETKYLGLGDDAP